MALPHTVTTSQHSSYKSKSSSNVTSTSGHSSGSSSGAIAYRQQRPGPHFQQQQPLNLSQVSAARPWPASHLGSPQSPPASAAQQVAMAQWAAFPWRPDGSRGTSAFLPPWVTLGEVRLPGSQRASLEYSQLSRVTEHSVAWCQSLTAGWPPARPPSQAEANTPRPGPVRPGCLGRTFRLTTAG